MSKVKDNKKWESQNLERDLKFIGLGKMRLLMRTETKNKLKIKQDQTQYDDINILENKKEMVLNKRKGQIFFNIVIKK